MSYDVRIKDEARKIVQWLCDSNYDAIVEYTNGVRLPADEIQYSVDQYGRTLVMPPDETFEELDVIEILNTPGIEWSVRCPLWTAEEGRSDLSLELTVVGTSDGNLRTEIDNVIVH